MYTVDDIPERLGKSGQEQLNYLRAYLKDSDSASYRYSDQLLIDLLITNDNFECWRKITGASKYAVPWTYTGLFETYIDRLRYAISDTVELSLKYTNNELENYLSFLPLKYVVVCLVVEDDGAATYPEDFENPIRIMRYFLDDQDLANAKYTDYQLVQELLSSCKNPYDFVIQELRKDSDKNFVESNQSGSQFASIDGISFASGEESIKTMEDAYQLILNEASKSIYVTPLTTDVYGYWSDGVNIAWEELADTWYEL